MSVGGVIQVEAELARSRTWTWEHVLRVVMTAVQFGLLALVIREFQLESRALYHTLLFALAGFVVQAALPRRWRMPWFLVLSVGAIFLLLSVAGLWVLAIGGVFLGLSLLPIPFGWRLSLIGGVLLGLMLLRAEVVSLGVPGYIWPVVGGMFMFRLGLYLYAVRHEGPPKDLWGTLAYFFMLPNAAFPFFPIIDYKTFLRQYYDAPESALYARGIAWMTRGVIHLLLYRLIYHYVVLDPASLRTLGDVVQYCMQTYLLYLRVSGQFHLIVGILYLFGFRLPETHHLYFLASSFTELWRRINIYWKDFMQKVVYQPTFFRLRPRGNDRAIVLATIVVMFVTWLLHSWQRFWLSTGPSFSVGDNWFWGLLGILVVIAAARDVKRAKLRQAPRKGYDLRRGLGTVMVFTTIVLLWAIWASDSMTHLFSILAVGRNVDLRGVVLLTGIIGFLLVVGGWDWGATDIRELKLKPLSISETTRHAALHASVLAALVLVARPGLRDSLGFTVSGIIAQVGSPRLNSLDESLLTRSYYETMSSPDREAGALWQVRQQQPADWVIIDSTSAWGFRSDFLATELVPNQDIQFKRQRFRTNSHGMHDREYPLAKPAGVYRVAILGASPVMGPGVPEDQVFDRILEEDLTALGRSLGRTVEVLNFGVAAYSPLQMVLQLEQKVLPFQPDLVLVTSMPPDRVPLGLHLATAVRRKIPIPDPAIRDALARAGVDSTSRAEAILRALGPLADTLLTQSVTRTDSLVRAHGARAALVLLRLPEYASTDDRIMAETAGRLGWPIIDLQKIYGTHPEQEFRIADYDRHWNERGHQLVADSQGLRQHAAALGLPPLWDAPGAPASARSSAVSP
jgi:D-alanyl-lipoteichoic acid acyltransferase DltB (MBOAT superfamily)